MTTKCKIGCAAALASALLALGGCGGGSGGSATAPPPTGESSAVPDGAADTAMAFIDFIKSLSKTDDTSEPATLKDGFTVPVDNASEPIGVSG